MKTRILITVPTFDGWIRQELSGELMKMADDDRFDTTIAFVKGRPLEEALNIGAHMCKGGCADFPYNVKIIYSDVEDLENGFDYWLVNDADNIPTKNFLDLAEMERDVIFGVYPIYQHYVEGMNPCRWGARCDEPVGKGLQLLKKGEGSASGAMMISRKVLEKMPQPIFKRTYSKKDGHVEQGVDYQFCEDARKAGFKIWVNWDYRSQHWNEVELMSMIVAHKNYYDKLYSK